MRAKTIHLLFAVFLAACSCLQQKSDYEAVASISVDRSVVFVGADPTVDTVYVSANRAWSVIPDSECDWVRFDTLEHINLVGAMDVTPLKVSVGDNVAKATRSSSFRIVGEGFSKTISVEQAAIVYRLSVDSPLEVTDLDDRGADVKISIRSNYNWNAWLKSGSDADVTITTPSGYRDAILTVHVGKNSDMEHGKTATIVIEVPECDPVEVVLGQKQAIPFVSCYVPEKDRFLDPNMFSSLGGTRWFNVESNVKWTASINTDESTAQGITLNVTSGEGNMDSFKVNVTEPNLDFDTVKKVVINFQPENGELYKYVLQQQKGAILGFEFRNQDNTSSVWPFIDPATSPKSTNKGEGWFTAPGGYKFHCYATTALYLYSQGFQCGSGATDWIEFPVMEGKSLVRISWVDYNGSTKPSVHDADGKLVTGGEYSSKFAKLTPFTWNLEGTQPGVAYRMVTNTTKTFRINCIEFEYQ